MKISKYTFALPQEDDCTVLYNCRTEAIAIIESELAELLSSRPLADIQTFHAPFYEFLKDRGFIVPDSAVEEEEVIEDWKEVDTDKRTFSIFINPTLDCNLRCWYCFEEHVKGSLINEEVFSSISRLIERKIIDEGVENLALSLFGGEPFVAFDSVVEPLIKATDKLCADNGRRFYLSFVTNGTLVTRTKLNKLATVCTANPISFQVTLDGNEFFHNKTKHFPNGKGSYQLILGNIRMILSYNMHVTLRLNMTEENIESYYDVLSDLAVLSPKDRELLTIDLQHVWQDTGNSDRDTFLATQTKVREAFIAKGFHVTELKHIDNSRCYADRNNNISVNYDGSLFNCTARDFTQNNSEGMLQPDGTLVWNDKYKKRISLKYGNAFCKKCRIFPLCHGGCSQYKLGCEHLSDCCIRGYDDLYIQKIVEDRVDYLLERIINKQNN